MTIKTEGESLVKSLIWQTSQLPLFGPPSLHCQGHPILPSLPSPLKPEEWRRNKWEHSLKKQTPLSVTLPPFSHSLPFIKSLLWFVNKENMEKKNGFSGFLQSCSMFIFHLWRGRPSSLSPFKDWHMLVQPFSKKEKKKVDHQSLLWFHIHEIFIRGIRVVVDMSLFRKNIFFIHPRLLDIKKEENDGKLMTLQ